MVSGRRIADAPYAGRGDLAVLVAHNGRLDKIPGTGAKFGGVGAWAKLRVSAGAMQLPTMKASQNVPALQAPTRQQTPAGRRTGEMIRTEEEVAQPRMLSHDPFAKRCARSRTALTY